MDLRFTKMHGLGNDFVVIDALMQPFQITSDQVRYLANRRFGIGCDQVLLVEDSRSEAADFRYRIFNADGNEVEQCGNGARCLARFLRDRGLTDASEIRVETTAGVIVLRIEADDQVTVNMGVPRLLPDDIPFQAHAVAPTYNLQVDNEQVEISVVSMGNPHAVLMVENVQTAPVAHLGSRIEAHPRFPSRVNVGFMQVMERNAISLRVYERGTGETLACGTGACAAVVAGRLRGLLDERVYVDLPGGRLTVDWSGIEHPVMMTGPATRVFEGSIEL